MKKTISIIGGGAAALILAAFLDPKKFNTTIYEKNKSLGRKFLVAGKGGFNLTHSEPIEKMMKCYTPRGFLDKALLNFSNVDLRNWLEDIGIPTIIGSSKKIYPEKGIKPIEVLNTIVNVLIKNNVEIKYDSTWTGWNSAGNLMFESGDEAKTDYTIFALGGGSWKVTGSDGTWLDLFKNVGIDVLPFQPSNCAYKIEWSNEFISKHEGKPLKNIVITCGNKSKKGEIIITKFGLEGNAIYALSPQIRNKLNSFGTAAISINLKPDLSIDEIIKRLENSKLKNVTEVLRRDLKLSPPQIGLIKSCTPRESFLNPKLLANEIKSLTLKISGAEVLDKAISTVGGISKDEIDENFQLNKIPNNFCIGEMLDWDAPTGGYLLQGSFSMAVYVARHLNKTS